MLLVSPERLNNPDFRDNVLPELAATTRPARRRRGALHLRLGPRLPPRLPAAAARCSAELPAGRAGAGHDRDRQRAGDRRRRRDSSAVEDAAGAARRAGPGEPAAGRARPAEPTHSGSAWLAEHLDELPGSGIIYTLTVAAAGEVAALPARSAATTVASYTGRTENAERLAGRGGAAGEPGQGAGRDVGAGHGVRQARPGLRGPPRRAAVPDRLLPAGRPRRPRRGARRGAAAARHARTRRSGGTSPSLAFPPRGAGAGACWRRSARATVHCRRPRWSRGSSCAAPGWR